MSTGSSLVSLADVQRFQKRFDQASASDSSSALSTLKMKDDDDDKYYARLLPFRDGVDEEPSSLFLWVLHFVDKVKISGHPEPFAACCTYFPRVTTSLVADKFHDAFQALPDGANLDEACFKRLIATIFEPKLTVSKVNAFRAHLLSGPRKPPDMNVDIHYHTLQKISNGLRYLSNDNAVQALTDDELKQAFYLGSPVAWRNEFKTANPLVADLVNHFNITDLLHAMRGYQKVSQEKMAANAQSQAKSRNPRDDSTSRGSTKRFRSSNGGRGGLRGGNRQSNGGRQASGDRPVNDGDACPYKDAIPSHANHTWANCIYNPQSSNFNQERFNAFLARTGSGLRTPTGSHPNNGSQNQGRNGQGSRSQGTPSSGGSRPIGSNWGAVPRRSGSGSDQHASEGTSTGDNPPVDPSLAEPLPSVQDAAYRARQRPLADSRNWSSLRNADRTVPGMCSSSFFTSSSPDISHHLDVLFAQQCHIQTGPPQAMPAENAILRPQFSRSANNCTRSTGVTWTSPTSTICPPLEATTNTVVSPCLNPTDAVIADIVDPNNGFLSNLDHYEDVYSSSSVSDAPSLSSPLSVAPSEPPSVPLTILMARSIGGVENTVPLRALLDSGADKTILHARCLQPGMHPRVTTRSVNTTMGTRDHVSEILLEDLVLPEFSRTKHISYPLWADIFDAPTCRYDIIIGRDLLRRLGIVLNFHTGLTTWDSVDVAMRHRDSFATDQTFMSHFIDIFADDPIIGDQFLLDSNYVPTDLQDLIDKQHHLTDAQKQDLLAIWQDCGKIFDGELREYPDRTLHLHLKPDAQPVHHRHFSVPRNIHDTFTKELWRFVDIGILERVGSTEWAAPHFAIPKKDGRIRMISDFRSLNAQLYRRVYPFPRIEDMLRKRKGYTYFTKLDISMCFYTFRLDEESSNLCVITTPFGKFRYRRLPMGVKQSPDFCQEIMEDVLKDFSDHVEVYIDDIGIFSNSWAEHVDILSKVLQRLQDKNFSINPSKCEWAVKETEWLGHWLTPTGIKPWKKKISAILALAPPKTMKELRSFIGMINFYRHMYPQRSHILAPLTSITGNKTLVWSPQCQRVFDKAKSMLAHDAFLRYPDHNLPFHVYVDASDYQLGAVIMQQDVPVAYYSRKLNPAQRNYTTMEKELLSIVETLKEFRSMLLGCAELHVHTDHKNLTYATLNSQRVLRWRLFLEEYHPIFHYVPGQDNVIADALSRLPLSEEEEKSVSPSSTSSTDASPPPRSLYDHSGQHSVLQVPHGPNDDPRSHHSRDPDAFESPIFMDEDLIDVYLNHPPINANQPLPVDYATIHQHQQNDAALVAKLTEQPQRFHLQPFPTENPQYNLICYRQNPNAAWRIRIPDSLLAHTVNWYHLSLNHLGSTRLRETISMHMSHPNLGLYCESPLW